MSQLFHSGSSRIRPTGSSDSQKLDTFICFSEHERKGIRMISMISMHGIRSQVKRNFIVEKIKRSVYQSSLINIININYALIAYFTRIFAHFLWNDPSIDVFHQSSVNLLVRSYSYPAIPANSWRSESGIICLSFSKYSVMSVILAAFSREESINTKLIHKK